MDELHKMALHPRRTADRPLAGMTVLVVEDSRFSSEAMRLLCLRSGARIRRADCLKSARRHLQVYRPNAAIIDLGLPDGSGADLIRELSRAESRIFAILGTSGDASAEDTAMNAGADGFLQKPVENLALFQAAILDHLPTDPALQRPRPVKIETIKPDKIAFFDDLANIETVLAEGRDPNMIGYAARFLSGVARAADDQALHEAAEALANRHAAGGAPRPDVDRVVHMVQKRLSAQAG